MVGKWHLGDSLHSQFGFEYWFGKPKGHTRTFYDAEAPLGDRNRSSQAWDDTTFHEYENTRAIPELAPKEP